MTAPARSWLLLRRHGALWGVAHAALAELPKEQPPRVALRSGEGFDADEVLTLAALLAVWPVPRAAARFLPPAARGLALWNDEPVVLIEGPPDAVRASLDNDPPQPWRAPCRPESKN